MGIKFKCTSCDFQLNVKAKLAGMRGICPQCKARIKIPEPPAGEAKTESAVAADSDESKPQAKPEKKAANSEPPPRPARKPAGKKTKTGKPTAAVANPAEVVEEVEVFQPSRSDASTASASSVAGKTGVANQGEAPIVQPTPIAATPIAGEGGAVDPFDEAPNAVWYVRPPGGGQFGPASADLMRQWIGEGRIGAHSLVWRDGWADWLVAQNVFAQLGGASESASPHSSHSSHSDAAVPGISGGANVAGVPAPGHPSPTNANQKKIDYYRTKKRKATCGIVVILVGILVIAALAILLTIVLTMN